MKKLIYILLIMLSSLFWRGVGDAAFAQQIKVDSLLKVYNNKSLSDTARIKALDALAWDYCTNNPDSAIILAEKQQKMAHADKLIKSEASAYGILGIAYENKGNYLKALECQLTALKLYEDINYKSGIGNCYTNIGIVYGIQSDYEKALEYYFKALQICLENKNKNSIGNCYNNIANIYKRKKEYDKSLEYHFNSLKIREEAGNKSKIAQSYINIGGVYGHKKDFAKGLDYVLRALKIMRETNDIQGIEYCYLNLGGMYGNLLNYKLANQYNDSGLQLSVKLGDINMQRTAYESMAETYAKAGRYKEAYENHVKFKTLTDSLFNTDNSRQLGDMKTKFEVEKKEAELKLKADAEQDKLIAIASEEKKRQQVVIAAVGGVLLIVVIFSLFLYKRFKLTQKQKKVIEEQKKKVDEAYNLLHEKNKEVMDSILYAKRIQTALITSEMYINNALNKLRNNN